MSECVPIASNPRFGERREGSVGRPAGPDVAILLESGELTSAPAAGEGEVCSTLTDSFLAKLRLLLNFNSHYMGPNRFHDTY